MQLCFRCLIFGIVATGIYFISCQSASVGALPDQVDFNFHIKPILSDRCFTCHGPDENARKADLRLDTEEGAFALLDSSENRYAIVAGDLKNSSLTHRIASKDPEYMMPPPESNLSLSEREIALLNRWIEQGATWKPHWAFIPPERPEIPTVQQKDWPRNEIDFFTLAKMEEQRLEPESPASKEKWLRRVSFDLIGLPPSPEEIDAFVEDDDPDAFEKVVDRLLASTAYGERMASVWLDVARYADSHGYQDDRPRTMWPWRDWVLDAFNANMPYDSFVVWQLAGDLLPNPTYEQKLATGFNRNHAITQEGGVVNEEYITEYVADRTNTIGTAFLGLTMECARCHDHKYDPISQKDYYSLFAFFNGINEKGQVNYFDEAPQPSMRVEDAELDSIIAFINGEVVMLEKQKGNMLANESPAFQEWLNKDWPKEDLLTLSRQGLLSYHLLEEVNDLETKDEMVADRPGRMNTGLQGELAPPALKPGFIGNALEFDGTNFLNLGDVGDFEWYHPFSLGAFIQAPAVRKKDAGLLVRRNGEQKRGGYELALTKDGHLRMSLIHNHQDERIVVQTTSKISPNQWVHVFATYDGSGRADGIQLFINGKKQTQKALEDQLLRKTILNGNDLLAGNWNHRKRIRADIEGFAGGKIDEIRVYDRELSPLEVQYISGPFFEKSDRQLNLARQGPARKELLWPHFLTHHATAFQELQLKLFKQRRSIQTVPNVMIMQEMEGPRPTFILARGAYDAPTERVEPAPLTSMLPFPETTSPNRLGLAKWITDGKHPLTARVMVNRLWQLMFGRGIVATPEDFGSQGTLPTHPRLLDWLAVSFVDSGWDMKAMFKQIALSATYRQSAQIANKKRQRDPENKYLARGPNQRLSAEMIRDNALAVSDLLCESVGGKWVKPYQPPGIWKELANQIGENKYREGIGCELYRRSLYSYWKRTIPPPTMLTFDASERAVCIVKRQSTSTPLQSLVLLNDPQYVEASRLLANRMLQKGGGKVEEGIIYGFRALTSRLPTEKELEVLTTLLAAERTAFAENPQKVKAYLAIGRTQSKAEVDVIELAAWTHLANTLLNLDEAKMRS